MPYWVHYQETSLPFKWDGPFEEAGKAERRAKVLQHTDNAADKFAEVIHGEKGKIGTVMTEYFNGRESQFPSRQTIMIPADAGEKKD